MVLQMYKKTKFWDSQIQHGKYKRKDCIIINEIEDLKEHMSREIEKTSKDIELFLQECLQERELQSQKEIESKSKSKKKMV